MNFFENYSHTSREYLTAVAATVGGVNGIAAKHLDKVPVGYCWRFGRYSVWSNTAAGSPTFELFAGMSNQQFAASFLLDRTTRLDFTNVWAANGIADNVEPPWFDEGESPFFVWSGLTNGDLCQATIQVKWYEKIPVLGHRASHQLLQRQVIVEEEQAAAAPVSSAWSTEQPTAGVSAPPSALVPWATPDRNDESADPASLFLPPGVGQIAGAGNQAIGYSPAIPGDDG